MALTLDRLRQVNIPINASNKPNNLSVAQQGLALYNDSVNLYDALALFVGNGGGGGGTDLSKTVVGNTFTVFSSTGTDITLNLATQTSAGIMSLADKIKLDGALSSATLVTGDGLIGDGSIGNPLDWAGAFTTGPVTGSGTQFFPINILNNSITSNHIKNGTILFQDWNQNSATTNQVPTWNGSAWVAATITGTLPAGTIGNMLYHNGTNWVATQRIKETVSGINSLFFNLASLPLGFTPFDLYKNGQLQTEVDDYNRTNQLMTMIVPLIPSDKLTIIYYI